MKEKELEKVLSIAEALVNKMVKNPQDKEDAIQDCYVTILERMAQYDPEKSSLSTYFYPWIKRSIANTMINAKGGTTYVGAQMRKMKKAYRNKEDKLYTDSYEVIAKNSGITKKMALHLINCEAVDISTALVVDRQTPEDAFIKKEETAKKQKIIAQQLSKLNSLQKAFVMDKYGVYGPRLSTQELAEKYSMSRQEVYNTSKQIKKIIRL